MTGVGTSRILDDGTHVLDHGGPEGAPLMVLLHGFGGSALNWYLVAPRLAEKYRVVAVDLYAHGRSAAPVPLDADAVVAQIERVVDSELAGSPRPVILVGGSFGATMALLLAAARPGLACGIFVVNGAIPVHLERSLDLAMAFKRRLISLPGVSGLIFRKTSGMTARAYVEHQLTGAGVDPAAVDPDLVRVSVDLEEARHEDRQAHDSQQLLLRDLLRIFARGRDFSAMAASVTAPVRWLHSDTDPLIPFPLAEAFVAARAGWEFRSRDGLGHVPMVVDPDWVEDEILDWAGGLPLAAPSP